MTTSHTDFEVDRKDYSITRLLTRDAPPALSEGQVRFRIDRFALTANNITYALTGDQLDYWSFFPAENGWGRIPAMGWADVVESAHPEIAVGGRYYGWYPMSSQVLVQARPDAGGLVDEAAHRANHAPIYRSYRDSSSDPLYDAQREDEHALLRGLFGTAFLADDFLFDHDFFGATSTVVLSASSKTAIGFAARSKARDRGPVIGVTSARNRAFVEGLGYYDQVAVYDAIEAIEVEGGAVLVDMAGNGDVIRQTHSHLGSRLRYSMGIGISHWAAGRADKDLPGPPQKFFFAPAQVKKRMEEWGPATYLKRLAEALGHFIEGSGRWLEIEHSHGAEAASATYQDLLAGRIPPHRGQMVSLHEMATS